LERKAELRANLDARRVIALADAVFVPVDVTAVMAGETPVRREIEEESARESRDRIAEEREDRRHDVDRRARLGHLSRRSVALLELGRQPEDERHVREIRVEPSAMVHSPVPRIETFAMVAHDDDDRALAIDARQELVELPVDRADPRVVL